MNCEIELLPVGSSSKAGDAIVVRYGYDNAYELMLVDGGHSETGDQIVNHLKANFGPTPVLEHVVLTHSDADHASGLPTVLENIEVRNLWLHIPWLLVEDSAHLFADPRWTLDGLKKKLAEEYDLLGRIVDLAVNAGCSVYYPFAGSMIGPFEVCSPTRYAYQYLLPQFDRTPDPNQDAIKAAGMWIGKASLTSQLIEAAKAQVQNWVKETWHGERLQDGGITSASNESSVVLYGDFGNERRVLLTGDAGVNALWWAADYAEARNLPLRQFSFVQIPHHGSRRNVGPTILNRLVGDILPEGSASTFSAFVSAPKEDSSHPRRIVMNAFKRRGGRPIATQGSKKVYWGGFTERDGYTDAEELPFYDSVESYS